MGGPAGPLVTSSLPQGGCATFLCQPLDVLKTRLMNSKGEYQVKSRLQAPGLAGVSAPYGRTLGPGPPHLPPCDLGDVCLLPTGAWGLRDKAVDPCLLPVAQLWVALASGWSCTFPRPWPQFCFRPKDFFHQLTEEPFPTISRTWPYCLESRSDWLSQQRVCLACVAFPPLAHRCHSLSGFLFGSCPVPGSTQSHHALLHLEGSSVHLSVLHCFPQGVFHCAMETAKLGPQAFYKVCWGSGDEQWESPRLGGSPGT